MDKLEPGHETWIETKAIRFFSKEEFFAEFSNLEESEIERGGVYPHHKRLRDLFHLPSILPKSWWEGMALDEGYVYYFIFSDEEVFCLEYRAENCRGCYDCM